jgi:hypothetical protein
VAIKTVASFLMRISGRIFRNVFIIFTIITHTADLILEKLLSPLNSPAESSTRRYMWTEKER